MDERRYVVDITRPLDSGLVAAASQAIASRLEMEPERIRTLLEGRVGAVTRPVLHEKAVLIAKVFAEARVAVSIREQILEADPVESARAPLEPAADAPATAPQPTSEAAPEVPPGAQPAARPELDEIWDDDSGWDAEQEVVAPWNQIADGSDTDLEQDQIDYRSYPTGRQPLVGDDLDDLRVSDDADALAESGAVQEPDAATGARDAGAADRRQPPPQPWRKDRPAHPNEPADDDRQRAALPSTRWVPSPFEDSQPNLREDPLPVANWLEETPGVKATGDTGRWWMPERPATVEPVTPQPEGPPLRNYLIWALLVSVIVLITLQVLFALRSPAAGGDYQGGLAAYRQGDFAAARRVWEPLAEAGDARSQYMLGHMVQNGQGQPWSNARAAAWYRLAAEQGLVEAQVALADLYLRGLGVPPDPQVAAQWLASAAQSGSPQAQVSYGELLLHGSGVDQDFAAALAWFRSAAAAGYREANDLLDFVAAAAPLLGAAEPTTPDAGP